MLCSTNEAGYGGTSERTAACVQVVQENPKCLGIEFDYWKLKNKNNENILNHIQTANTLCIFIAVLKEEIYK